MKGEERLKGEDLDDNAVKKEGISHPNFINHIANRRFLGTDKLGVAEDADGENELDKGWSFFKILSDNEEKTSVDRLLHFDTIAKSETSASSSVGLRMAPAVDPTEPSRISDSFDSEGLLQIQIEKPD